MDGAQWVGNGVKAANQHRPRSSAWGWHRCGQALGPIRDTCLALSPSNPGPQSLLLCRSFQVRPEWSFTCLAGETPSELLP
jgi:hypothetical protein